MFLKNCRHRRLIAGFVLAAAVLLSAGGFGDGATAATSWAPANANAIPVSKAVESFLSSHCLDCHAGPAGEAGVDLEAVLSRGLDAVHADEDRLWARVIDRVVAGEMPPPEAEQPSANDRQDFATKAGDWLRTTQRLRQATLGRVRGRRLTRLQVERSLQDLLGIDIPLADKLPDEGRPRGFTTVAERQAVSHHHLASFLNVVDLALDEAFGRALQPAKPLSRDLDPMAISRTNPRRRCREPEIREGRAVVWSCSMPFYGRIPATTAPADGWYRFRLHGSGIKLPESGGVWTAVHSGPCVSTAPLLDPVISFEAGAEPRLIEFETWLPKGHMLEVRPQDSTIKRAYFKGGQVGTGEGEPQNVPGIAIDRIEMEQIHRHPLHALQLQLFEGIALVAGKNGRLEPAPDRPAEDLGRLLRRFAHRAFRRETEPTVIEGISRLSSQLLAEGRSFTEALRAGYRAILCSPEFCYFIEQPGPLDQLAIAARLSYFLTGHPPDATLTELARAGRLRDRSVLRGEVDRLLGCDAAGQPCPGVVGRAAPARQFVIDFAGEWLDLDQIDFTQPDRKLYWQFDPIVRLAMLDETHAFLTAMLLEDRPVGELVNANHTFLNSRLARYYGIPPDGADGLKRVTLPADSHRGGLLTQGAILKVTANGSTTSPVVRGAWVAERLLGVTIPPPPAGVPAIEPDIRGAATIREQLEKHRSAAACASCHRLMDPYGFALEAFDPAGRWRDHYPVVVKGKRKQGPAVEPADRLPDGRAFADIDELRQLLAVNPDRLARGLAGHLLVYGTGGELAFADRQVVEAIVAEAAAAGYGLRSLLKAVVTSPLFLSK